jgi:ABC-type transport system involved in cytochrome c biogenesis permease subunit
MGLATVPGTGLEIMANFISSATVESYHFRRPNLFVRCFGNVWLGVIVMVLILFYACVASALPQVRGALEMTEMQIFRHWIFAVLMLLFCISLTTVTLTRIRWSRINAGVWIVHTGLLLLAGGSFAYFASKIEGDVLLRSPRIEIVSLGAGQRVIGKILAEKGQRWSSVMPAFGGQVSCDVLDISRNEAGVTRARVRLMQGDKETGTIDVVAGLGPTPVGDSRLGASLMTAPAEDKFYDDHEAALYVRQSGRQEPIAMPIHGLPLHRERYLDEGYVLQDTEGRAVASKRRRPELSLGGFSIPSAFLEGWRMPISLEELSGKSSHADLPFDIQVTGYVPYISDMRASAADGGDKDNPAAVVSFSFGDEAMRDSLFAMNPVQSMLASPVPIELTWAISRAEAETYLAKLAGPHELHVEVKDPPIKKTYSISQGQVIKVDGSAYELTIKELRPNWPMMTPGYEGAASPMASVDVVTGKKHYNRTVIQRFPHLSQDIDEGGVRHREGPYDPNLVLKYRTSVGGWITIVAAPDMEPVAGVFDDEGEVRRVDIVVGRKEPFQLRGLELAFTVESFFRKARMIEQPVVEPLERRRPNIAARSMSAVRLKLAGRGDRAGWSETRWCAFSQYPHVDARPITVRVPGEATDYEIIYSRTAHDLHGKLMAGKLSVTYFPGRQSVESWRSDFFCQRGNEPLTTAAVYTNQTAHFGPWTLFQSGAAGDHWSYTILGVGNRNGIIPMVLGCVLIAIGCLYAFYVKPVLKRRALRGLNVEDEIPNGDRGDAPIRHRPHPVLTSLLSVILILVLTGDTFAADPFAASSGARELDAQIDWQKAKLIAVQDAGRYKTLDSFARESMTELYGHESLPGLSAPASLFELLFRREAYLDTPIVRIKDRGVQIHFTSHMPEASMRRIRDTGYMTLRELEDPVVAERISELESKSIMVTAMRRVRNAEAVARFLSEMTRIVPDPRGGPDAAWHTPEELQSVLPGELRPAFAAMSKSSESLAGFNPQQALAGMAPWAGLWKAWTQRDVAGAQTSLDRLADVLPSLAQPGVYPSQSQRAAEARYYSWGKFTWGYWIYLLGAMIGVWALVTKWSTPWRICLVLLFVALGVHAYGLALRWYILGRIPVANMFEAVVASAWVGIAVALVVELIYKTRFFLVASHVTGFFALVLAGYVVPGGGTLTFIMGILDDVMLRIHTVLIISSYSLIFLAAVIAVIYLFGYYFHTMPRLSGEIGLISAAAGALLLIAAKQSFEVGLHVADGMVKRPNIETWFAIGAGVALLICVAITQRGAGARAVAYVLSGLIACTTLAIGNYGFCTGMAWTMIAGGMTWAGANMVGQLMRTRVTFGQVALAGAGGPALLSRPILAGAMPGDENSSTPLPAWLNHADWSHLIILNMMFVMLFIGVILGAVWADYSWGRPWGWDPKEVFAMNTWIVYAILIHIRYLVRNKGLWTAWLSIAGCLMMAFNWCFVNFYIVGLHSYA